MFADAIESILKDQCTPAVVRAIEGGASAALLAAAIEDAGFHALLTPEADGGAGAGWPEFHSVVTLCGAYAVPLPLPQTMASRLLATADELPTGLVTFAPALIREAGGALRADLVPAGRLASHVIGAAGDTLFLLATSQAQQEASGVHGSLAASFRWNNAGLPLKSDVLADQFHSLAALLHAALLAGAMKRVFDMTVTYANQRVQFGKSISKFQAIQQQLSVMAEHVVAASIATEAAFHGVGAALPRTGACAVAKARTSEAAQLVASIAHGVHGAIGVTKEYDLQLYTRRLHEWRIAHGSEAHWNRRLGGLCVDSGELLVADFARQLF